MGNHCSGSSNNEVLSEIQLGGSNEIFEDFGVLTSIQ